MGARVVVWKVFDELENSARNMQDRSSRSIPIYP
jgi:hypothetical protein